MRVLIGDETGLLKSIELEKQEQRLVSHRPQNRFHSIQCMTLNNQDGNDVCIIVSRANGILEAYDSSHPVSTGNQKSVWEVSKGVEAEKTIVNCIGIGMLQNTNSVIRCYKSGDVTRTDIKLQHEKLIFTAGSPLDRMRVAPNTKSEVIGVGGKEVDMSLYNVETGEAIFKAKNVRHDTLDMRVPVWVKDFAFLPSASGHKVLVGTAYNQVRLYDSRTQRRPIQDFSFGDHPITAISLSHDENIVYVADTTGNLDALDLRVNGRHLGRFVGAVGSIRGLAIHPSLPYIAAAGLDRTLRVYSLEDRSLVYSEYMKQRVNTLIFCPDGKKIHQAAQDEIEEPVRKRGKLHNDEEDDEEDDEELEEEDYEGLEISEEEVEEDESSEDSD